MGLLGRIDAFSRRLRPLLVLRQLRHRRALAENGRIYRELGVDKRWYAMVRHADVAGRGGDGPPLDAGRLEQLEGDPRFQALPEDLRGGLRAWPERGYMKLDGFFERAKVEAINADVDSLLASGKLRRHNRSPRVMNAHQKSEPAAELTADPRLLELLSLIMSRPARLFQTICFVHGSQQSAHSDAFHMMTEPPGYLVGVWVALEDIDEEQGPVFYLPGSHRLDYVMTEDLELDPPAPLLTADKGRAYVKRMREQVARAGGEPETFTARAGDVLLWHHNLLHGGSAIARSGSTRRSLVGHYFATDVLCYHEVTERPALISPAAAA